MNARKLTGLALFLAMTIVLTAFENTLPPVPFLPPGVKLGLPHVVIMYCVFHGGKGEAVLLCVLKALFVLLTRGPIAALLSLSGGLLSLLALILLILVFKNRTSYTSFAITGAITHNTGQLAVYSLIAHVNMLPYYMPLLMLSGVAAGMVTGTLLRFTAPVLNKYRKDAGE